MSVHELGLSRTAMRSMASTVLMSMPLVLGLGMDASLIAYVVHRLLSWACAVSALGGAAGEWRPSADPAWQPACRGGTWRVQHSRCYSLPHTSAARIYTGLDASESHVGGWPGPRERTPPRYPSGAS